MSGERPASSSRAQRGISVLAALLTLACAETPAPTPDVIYVWSGAMDSTQRDALVVLDADSLSPSYGREVGRLALESSGGMPHHIEPLVSADQSLIANAWAAGTSYVFDVVDPLRPIVRATLTTAGGTLAYPHDFARLANGTILAAYNSRTGQYIGPGGLARLDADGAVVASASGAMAGIADTLVMPYSVIALPDGTRALVALTEMGMAPPPGQEPQYRVTSAMQLWTLEPLAPTALISLPTTPEKPGAELFPSTPLVLANGAVFVNTFSCGLYRVDGTDGNAPTATFVHGFPGGAPPNFCAVATAVGNYWIQAVAELPGLVVLDLSDPTAPREVSRLALDPTKHPGVHWVSRSGDGRRLAITGEGHWVLMARFDPTTGAIALDSTFQYADPKLHPHGVAFR
jgi:hypothetical protein